MKHKYSQIKKALHINRAQHEDELCEVIYETEEPSSSSDWKKSARTSLQSNREIVKVSPNPDYEPTMFYACIAIMVMFVLMIVCLVISIIDLDTYNFGLYFVLLCIVGIMLACALCIANPQMCSNPAWYTRLCNMLHEMYPDMQEAQQQKKPLALSAMMRKHQESMIANESENESKVPLRPQSRATVMMLAPAMHVMHQVWKGMAWVAEEIDDTEEDTNDDLHTPRSRSYEELPCTSTTLIDPRKLSAIPEREEELSGAHNPNPIPAPPARNGSNNDSGYTKSPSLVDIVIECEEV